MEKNQVQYTPPFISLDYAIKHLLKSKENYGIIENFLSTLISVVKYNPIKITALLDPESTKERKYSKKSIADLMAEDQEGNKYIIEVERAYKVNFFHKSCFNTSRAIVDSISSSVDYVKITKVIHIVLLFDLPPENTFESTIYHGKTEFRSLKKEFHSAKRLSKDTKQYNFPNIYPEYFVICVPNYQDKVEDDLDEWLYVLKHGKVPQNFQGTYMSQVRERINYLNMDEDVRNSYIRYKLDMIDLRESHKTSYEAGNLKGLKKGIEKGKEEGLKEGMEKGKEEGLKEGQKKIAKKLLSLGMKEIQISQATGLTIAEIENIK